MALGEFLLAVQQASRQYAAQYGLTVRELELALLATAASEGGLGETASIGDGGLSVGRFHFHIEGGHGSTLLNEGYSLEQISDDVFQAWHWAPLMAQAVADAKALGFTGNEALRQAAFALERPQFICDPGTWHMNIGLATDALATAGLLAFGEDIPGFDRLDPMLRRLLGEIPDAATGDKAKLMAEAMVSATEPIPDRPRGPVVFSSSGDMPGRVDRAMDRDRGEPPGPLPPVNEGSPPVGAPSRQPRDLIDLVRAIPREGQLVSVAVALLVGPAVLAWLLDGSPLLDFIRFLFPSEYE